MIDESKHTEDGDISDLDFTETLPEEQIKKFKIRTK